MADAAIRRPFASADPVRMRFKLASLPERGWCRAPEQTRPTVTQSAGPTYSDVTQSASTIWPMSTRERPGNDSMIEQKIAASDLRAGRCRKPPPPVTQSGADNWLGSVPSGLVSNTATSRISSGNDNTSDLSPDLATGNTSDILQSGSLQYRWRDPIERTATSPTSIFSSGTGGFGAPSRRASDASFAGRSSFGPARR